MERGLWTVSQAAKFLGINTIILYRWIAKRKIPAVRISTRCLRLDPRRIDKWLEANAIDVVTPGQKPLKKGGTRP